LALLPGNQFRAELHVAENGQRRDAAQGVESMKFEDCRRRTFAALLLGLIASCGGGSSDSSSAGVASITLGPTQASISVGQTVTYSAVARDAQGTAVGGAALVWQSSNDGVASVGGGVATGVAAGSVTISASSGAVSSKAVALSVTAATVPPASPLVPVNTAIPVITAVDHASFLALATSQGSWSNSPTAFAFRWTRNGAAIAGATLATYDTTSADQGAAIAAVVTASNAAGGTSATSLALSVPTPTLPANNPTLGAHGLAYHVSGGSIGATLSTPAMGTQSGSTLLAFVGKGSVFYLAPPSDNKGNAPYVQIGTVHEYTRWPGEGTAMYAFNSIVGGTNHLVSIDDSNVFDEVSFATVEVRNGGVIQDFNWKEVLNSASQTSGDVTTTGPATLVAVWYGDDASSTPSNPVPNNGFTVIERVGGAIETVQMFVATKNVSAAGTYNVTWNTTPLQGAQLYLIAVQKQ
jgi:Bacterial Ig-like domain (group 2)